MNRLLREMTDEQRNALLVGVVLLAVLAVFEIGVLLR